MNPRWLRSSALLLAALLLVVASPARAVKLNRDVLDAGHVCLESNRECYWLPYTDSWGNLCVTGYDQDNDGVGYGYACTRPLGACALEESWTGDGATCVRLLTTDSGGDLCLVAVADAYESFGYEQFVCIGDVVALVVHA